MTALDLALTKTLSGDPIEALARADRVGTAFVETRPPKAARMPTDVTAFVGADDPTSTLLAQLAFGVTVLPAHGASPPAPAAPTDEESQRIAERRIAMLRRMAGSSTTEDALGLEKLNIKLRRLLPRVTEEDAAHLKAMAEEAEELARWAASKRGR